MKHRKKKKQLCLWLRNVSFQHNNILNNVKYTKEMIAAYFLGQMADCITVIRRTTFENEQTRKISKMKFIEVEYKKNKLIKQC
jgi:hypothetical protein